MEINLSMHRARHRFSRRACHSVTSALMTGTERTWRRQRCTSLDISASSDVALSLQLATKTGGEIAGQSPNLDEETLSFHELFLRQVQC